MDPRAEALAEGPDAMSTVHLTDYLRPEFLAWDIAASDKPEVLAALARAVAERVPALDSETVLRLLKEREELQSTGIGQGMALPHAMIPGIEHPILLVARVRPGVDFEACDGGPVDLLFMILTAPEDLKVHVRLLARLARIIGQESFLETLRAAAGPDEALRLLVDEDARHV
jgi:PTS system nitrogen regulatory IIA component